MTDFFCNKVKTATSYALMPAHQQDEDEIKKLPKGQPLRVKVTRMRNIQFFRKWWALVDYAFNEWTPPADTIGEKNRERFRKDLIIRCGFYQQHVRIDGSIRTEARSIAFKNMTEDEFEELYDKTIDVIIKYVQMDYNYTPDELRVVIEQILEFDG